MLFFTLGCLCIVIAIDSLANSDSPSQNQIIERTIQNSREIESLFKTATNFVDEFRDKHKTYPNNDHFREWSNAFPELVRSPRYLNYFTNDFPDEAIDIFGTPSGNSFLFQYWRGGWNEYYASWVNLSTLSFDREDYVVTKLENVLQMLLGLILVVVATVLTSPRRTNQILKFIKQQFRGDSKNVDSYT